MGRPILGYLLHKPLLKLIGYCIVFKSLEKIKFQIFQSKMKLFDIMDNMLMNLIELTHIVISLYFK